MKNMQRYIDSFVKRAVFFYKEKFKQLVFLVILLPIFILAHKLQYINIIPQYHYYVVGIYFLLIMILFSKQVSSKKIYIFIEGIVVLSLIANIIELFFPTVSIDLFGFVIFVLLFAATITDFFIHRGELRKVTND